MKGVMSRRRLDWYHYDSDGILHARDAVARIRFDADRLDMGLYEPRVWAIGIYVHGRRAWGHDCVVSGFEARNFASVDGPFDGTLAEALTHAIKMAEQWAHWFMGPGWEVVPLEEVRAAELALYRPGHLI